MQVDLEGSLSCLMYRVHPGGIGVKEGGFFLRVKIVGNPLEGIQGHGQAAQFHSGTVNGRMENSC